MENQFFLGAQGPPLDFGQSLSSPLSTAWQSLSSPMETQATELNSTDYGLQFESALSSMVSSPVASNSNLSNESFMIRELIGKLGSIGGNSGEISPQPLIANSTNTSCYSTPLNSPPKLSLPLNTLVKEKLPSLGKSMGMNSSVADFSADPGFAERAAKFSCFGSRSFNGRTSQLGLNDTSSPSPSLSPYRSNPLSSNPKIPRVSSSPSLNAMVIEPLQDRSELSHSQEESSITNGDPSLKPSKGTNSRKRKTIPKAKTNEISTSPSTNARKGTESNEKRCKSTESNGNQNDSIKTEDDAKGNTKPPEPPKDYIHVRARRGQATDSHSLAERVRREKISERMKLLQNLVPGCNKVTGKALMLDEIINYVQSLQRQVEFLSMKLASVNTRLDFNMDSLMPKEMFQSNDSLAHQIFPMDSSATAIFEQQNPALHHHHAHMSNGTMSQCLVGPLDTSIHPNLNTHLPQIHHFTPSMPQYPTFCEGDLQTIVEMGLGQNQSREMALQSEFQGSNQVSEMKVEL
ncbi:hypothetical protein J1N35_002231 [Gossypium stocksii]|uniref:BHLH domain-containing protein n=1 Tax=Gossypium stocksii TaxID=47602 RepID=A0A9D3WLC6_9ROSI|nr:hypothetical protein J1N35_002231 [Gossypium stocksii]